MSNDKIAAAGASIPQLRAAKKLQRDGWVLQTTLGDGTMVFYRKQRIKKRWIIFWSIMTLGIGLLYFLYAAANRRTDSRMVALDGSVV